MKKLLFILLLISPFSVFAGVDTDRICADSSLYGKIDQTITVSYPGETVSVGTVWKGFYSFEPTNTYNPKGEQRLYYVVNISSKKTSELYSYNCKTQKPSLILTMKMSANEIYYDLDFLKADNLILVGRDGGIAMGPTQTIIAYNIRSKSKLFTYKDTKGLMDEGRITGFISGKGKWYMYITSVFNSSNDSLYEFDKNTKKLIKM